MCFSECVENEFKPTATPPVTPIPRQELRCQNINIKGDEKNERKLGKEYSCGFHNGNDNSERFDHGHFDEC